LGFQDGLIKVGQSIDAQRRIRQHEDNGAAYGNPVVAQWASPRHPQVAENERALIAHCMEHGRQVRGREWFTDVTFESVRSYALTLPFACVTPERIEQREHVQRPRPNPRKTPPRGPAATAPARVPVADLSQVVTSAIVAVTDTLTSAQVREMSRLIVAELARRGLADEPPTEGGSA
jgi:hypothetical protein